MRTRSIAANLLIVLISSAITAEATLRVYDWLWPSPIFYSHSYRRFLPPPGTPYFGTRINSLGFKDTEFPSRKGEAFRVVALGDSFAFGIVPYADSFLTLAEDELRARGIDAEILNLGIPGIGPREYVDVLREIGLGLDPDLLLVCIFIGNDFLDSRERDHRWYDYSYAASLVYYLVYGRPGLAEAAKAGHFDTYDDNAPTLKQPGAFLRLERSHAYIYRVGDTNFAADLELAVGHLARIEEICRERGIDLAVILMPTEIQVSSEVRSQVVATIKGADEMRWDLKQPNEALSRWLAERGIAHLDLYPSFAREGARRRLYRLRDTHWNIPGNRLAAQHVSAFLAERIMSLRAAPRGAAGGHGS